MVRLGPLMDLAEGREEVAVGIIDGPVDSAHPDFANTVVQYVRGSMTVRGSSGAAGAHGTFVAGVLGARRGSPAPAVCPGCTLFPRPIFTGSVLAANAEELATAMAECMDAGARVINVSAAFSPDRVGEAAVREVLDDAVRRGVLVVVAAGGGTTLGGSPLTRHPWTIPVIAFGRTGRVLETSTLGASIGRRGLGAPGADVTSLAAGGGFRRMSGSSVAAPFVTGAVALIWSVFPDLHGSVLRAALHMRDYVPRTVVPPMLDAWGVYRTVTESRR